MVTARLLPAEEWPTVLGTLEPYATFGLPDPTHWCIPVVEVDGQYAASCALFNTVHWDQFHVAEDYRKHPVVFAKLLQFSVEQLQVHGVAGVHITVPDDRPDLQAMVEQFGFVPAPGKLYLYAVPPAKV